jgi:glycosyltransferase involved in cell wall biosynthesis
VLREAVAPPVELDASRCYDARVARIAIDARVITGERDGVGRYARGLVPALAAEAPGDEFLVLRHLSNLEPIASSHPNVIEVPTDGVVGHLVDHYLRDHRRLAAVFDEHGWPDLFHSLFHVCSRRLHALRQPGPAVLLTLHDMIWLERPFSHGRLLTGLGNWVTGRIAVAGSLRRADAVIAVSQATASRAGRYVPAERLAVIHHGVDEAFTRDPPPLPPAFRQLEGGGRPWVAAMAYSKSYKNVALVLRAFAVAASRGLDARLVLIGRDTALEALAASLGVRSRVLFTGEVDDEALRALVGRAALFVHAATTEGFGMPVVEAMALGTPTAVADVEVLREVGGEGVVRFDASQPRELARVIEDAVGMPDARRAWSARARARAGAFDWHTCARETLGVYASVLGRRHEGPDS